MPLIETILLTAALAQAPLPARCYGTVKYSSGEFVGSNKTVKAMSKTDTIQTLTYVINDTTWFRLDFPKSDTIRFTVDNDSCYIFPNSGDSTFAYVLSGKWNETNLRTKNPDPLAVELSSFFAQAYPDRIILNWRTESEINNYIWNIYEGNIQNRIGQVPAAGNTNTPQNYSFIHFCNGRYIYWLGDQDINGREELHGPIEAATLEQIISINRNLYPNPFSKSTRIPGNPNQLMEVSVYNGLGQVVRKLNGTGFVDWDGKDENGRDVSSGVYNFKISTKPAQDLNIPITIEYGRGIKTK